MQIRKYGELYLLKQMSSNKPGCNTRLQSVGAKSLRKKYAEKLIDIGLQVMLSEVKVLLYHTVRWHN